MMKEFKLTFFYNIQFGSNAAFVKDIRSQKNHTAKAIDGPDLADYAQCTRSYNLLPQDCPIQIPSYRYMCQNQCEESLSRDVRMIGLSWTFFPKDRRGHLMVLCLSSKQVVELQICFRKSLKSLSFNCHVSIWRKWNRSSWTWQWTQYKTTKRLRHTIELASRVYEGTEKDCLYLAVELRTIKFIKESFGQNCNDGNNLTLISSFPQTIHSKLLQSSNYITKRQAIKVNNARLLFWSILIRDLQTP
ncbi:hypothetical protein ISN45_Aa06g028010 [Arabidopsis thaliana x Arabidopsis arenosa]|uniref:Uncharacterized protein n=1 Tax=Arabidopsis thaliana x Arabidopsis arenosa TaxID=1240361 RepID=A0A8T1Z045_9BRAS|nr:hypothetical protein ISN45_Aa06g028010 [Arabidopsis thaliana x Arabidopsis arenosa]